VIPCEKRDVAKFLHGTWKNPWIFDRTKDGRGVIRTYRNRGKLFIPGLWLEGEGGEAGAETGAGTGTEDATAVLEVVVHNTHRRQKMDVRINGKYGRTAVDVAEGRSRVRVEMPSRLWRRGENRLRLSFRRSGRPKGVGRPDWRSAGYRSLRWVRRPPSSVAIETVGVGGAEFRLPDEAELRRGFARRLRSGEGAEGGFSVPAGGAVTQYVVPPPKARLFFRFRAPGDEGERGGERGERGGEADDGDEGSEGGGEEEVTFKVIASRDGKKSEVLFSRVSSPGADGCVAGVVDLSRFSGGALRLDLTNEGGRGEWLDVGIWSPRTPRVVLPKKPIKYVFFWLADALRRDCVGLYGSKKVKTPRFDAFGKKAVMFERPTIQGNHSKPSHGTILTGTYPPVHGFVHSKSRVRGTLIYQQLKKAGWKTAMFSSNGYVSRSWGFARGLDEYVNFIRAGRSSEAKTLWRSARRFLKRNLKDKVFMYLLTIDPHVTYGPPKKYLKMYYPGRYRGPVPRRATGFFLEKLITGRIKLRRRRDLERLKALYYGEITYNDHWFGAMLDELERLGIRDESVVVVSSDHGDQFKEHGSYGHAKNLHEEEIAVPLLVWWPGLPKRGIRIPWDVEVMDIYSTLLDLAGVEQNGGAQSASLVSLVKGGRAEAMHAAFSYHAGVSRSATMGRYKLITVNGRKSSLYDLEVDPGETRSVASSRPVAFRLMRNVFSLHNAYVSEWRKSRWGRASNLEPRFYDDSRSTGSAGSK
jgi:arylsulfatase A-like enzyme